MLNINKNRLMLGQYEFDKNLIRKYNGIIYSLVAISKNKKKIIKIEFLKHPQKKNSLLQEARILKHLNNKNCLSAPELIDYGLLKKKNFLLNKILVNQKIDKKPSYLVTKYLENNSKPNLVDIILTICEQKKFGIFHADIKKSNLRYDAKKGICYFIDYDQAEILSKKIKELNISRFVKWCNILDNKKYNITENNCFRQIKDIYSHSLLNKIILNNKLNLKYIILHKYLELKKKNFFHFFQNYNLLYNKIEHKRNIFQSINFKKNEKILCLGFDYKIWRFFYFKNKLFFYLYNNENFLFNILKIINNFFKFRKNFFLLKNTNEINKSYDTIIVLNILYLLKNKMLIKLVKKVRKIILYCEIIKIYNFFNILKSNFGTKKNILFLKSQTKFKNYLEKNFKNFKVKKIETKKSSKILYELLKK